MDEDRGIGMHALVGVENDKLQATDLFAIEILRLGLLFASEESERRKYGC